MNTKRSYHIEWGLLVWISIVSINFALYEKYIVQELSRPKLPYLFVFPILVVSDKQTTHRIYRS